MRNIIFNSTVDKGLESSKIHYRKLFKRVLLFFLVLLTSINIVFSQEETSKSSKVEIDLGADLVSSYLWRGVLIDTVPNVQGWGELSAGGFFLGVWASSNFRGSYFETDIYAGYSIGNFTATLTDYFLGTGDVLNFKSTETSHAGELALQYIISDNFPLQITAATILYGADLKLDSIGIDEEAYFRDEANYSTYLELMYPASIGGVDLEFAIGGVTHESYFYVTEGAALTNISVKTSKAISITERFELPISFQVAVNPELESLHAVFSLSF